MLWFGRIDAGVKWGACAGRVAREVLAELIPRSLQYSWHKESGKLLVDTNFHAPVPAAGRLAAVTITEIAQGTLERQIEWTAGLPPRDMRESGEDAWVQFVRFDVRLHGGRQIAGAYLMTDGLYTLEEVRAAIEVSMEGGFPRAGRYSVLASARRPVPTLRPIRAGDYHSVFSVFRCENHACPSGGSEMLIAGSARVHDWHRPDAVAYPCPSCNGRWEDRWALKWVRLAGRVTTPERQVIDYPVPPTQRRRSPFSHPIRKIMGTDTASAWRGWERLSIPPIPAAVKRFLQDLRPAAYLRALQDDPGLAGTLSAALLTPRNFRALVDDLRELNDPERASCFAKGLAHAYCPRRMIRYSTAEDEKQQLHYPYIACEPGRFAKRMYALGALGESGRFLDVGCGIGEKVFLAYALGQFERCDGLEYEPKTLTIAEFLLRSIQTERPYPIRFIQGDALEFDRYDEYEVIYLYRPFRDRAAMGSLVRRIASQMKPGATMFDIYDRRLAMRKTAKGRLVTFASVPETGFAEWTEPVELEGFLEELQLR